MLKPILDRVLVRRIEKPQEGDIVIPEAYRQASRRGTVEAIGDFVVLGGQAFPLSTFLSVGDIVQFGEYNAEPMEDGLVLVRIQDIRGKE
jgi:co-chaperonin GroES (HSP10)